MTLRTKASFLISIIIIIVMGVSGIYYLHFLQRSLKASILAGVEGVSESTSQAISKFLADSLKETQAIALALPVEALEQQDRSVIRNRLKLLLDIFPKFENGMFILDKNGRLWVDYPQSAAEGTDFSYREYFQRTLKEKKGIVGVPYVSGRTGQPVLTFTALLRGSDNRVLGVLGCSVQMLSPDALGGIRSIKIGRSGYIFVYDSSRTMILHPQNERVLQQDIPPGANKLLDAALAGIEGVGETVNSRGVPMLSSFKRIPGTDWIVAAQQPQSEAYAPLVKATGGLLLSIVLMVMVAVVLVAIAMRRVTKPLTKLRQAVMFFGREESAESQKVSNELEMIRSGDEIGDLARAFLDISKKLDETLISLKRANNDWERTFNTVPDLIAIVDKQYNIIKINQAMADRFGINPHDAPGLKCYTLFHGTDEPLKLCPHERLLEDGQEHIEEIAEKRLDSIFLVTASPLRDQDGELIGSLHVARDITELKRAQEERLELARQLLQAQKLESLGVLAGGIAHDLNNIMMVILGNLDLLGLVNLPEKSRERLINAEKACEQAQTLANRLLTFAKGGLPIKKIHHLGELLHESASLALSGSRSKSSVDLGEDLWAVAVDASQMIQVFCNLFINADQAMPQGGAVVIRAENVKVEKEDILPLKTGKYVKITIADQGLGIQPPYLDKVFDPYFTTKPKGSGLGLTTAYSIVKQHQGHLAVESVSGVGTTFTVYLPASETDHYPEKREVAGPIIGQGRILLIDDEATVREVLGEMLAELGYQVSFATEGREAIQLYKQAQEENQPFAAAIMDLTIPGGLGGKETLEEIKKIDPQVRAIVSSGYSDDAVMAEYHKYGFSGAIAKPYSIIKLSHILNKAIK
jgi:PAS domain S-box-containing protein